MIKIGDTNKCTVCGKDFVYRFTKWADATTPEGFWEVKFKTFHPPCGLLMDKINRIKREKAALDKELEESIFKLHYNRL
jgi:hypothetical protein